MTEVTRAVIEVGDDGVPRPVTRTQSLPVFHDAARHKALLEPYRYQPEDPPYYQGLNNLEAMNLRVVEQAAQRGDLEAYKYLTDRDLGKPQQKIQQTTLTATLQDFLAAVEAKEAADPLPPIDAEIIAAAEQNTITAPRVKLAEGL